MGIEAEKTSGSLKFKCNTLISRQSHHLFIYFHFIFPVNICRRVAGVSKEMFVFISEGFVMETRLHWHATLHSRVFAHAVASNSLKNDSKPVQFDHTSR